jgi:Ser-tRNA(Ala) deacylase AlaX
MSAKVREILPETARRFRVLLDRTVFYPMGGGQPTDQGTLSWNNAPQAKVYQVMMKDGEIWHYLEPFNHTQAPLEVGQPVEGEIDWERRYQNMRVHAGGHLVDFALFRLGLVPGTLRPLKGDHGKKPYVLYEGYSEGLTPARLVEEVEKLIAEKLEFNWEFASLEELQQDAIYLQPGLPSNKPLRKLKLSGVGSVADGGTLVRNSSEVKHITISSIDDIDGQVKISYQL